MKKHHPDNERVKHKYFIFLKEAKRQNEASVDAVAKAVSRFECYTQWRDFKAFHFEQAVGFKAHLARHRNGQTGAALSKATMHSTARTLKVFFQWLAMQPGYKSRINYTDTEYFNLSEKDARVAGAKRHRPFPTLEQVKRAIAMMQDSVIERRNRALVAFTLLTGARDSAIASLKLKHVDLEAGSVFQDARDVNTKGSKTFTTYFFPVGDETHKIVREWVTFLKEELLFGLDDPLFPKTKVKQNAAKVFEPVGVMPEHWRNAAPIRKVFKGAFEQAGLPFQPAQFPQNTATRRNRLPEPKEFKAWSQNLGHEGVLTTFFSYGEVQERRQCEIFKALQVPRVSLDLQRVDELAKAVAREMRIQMESSG